MDASPETSDFFELSTGRTAVLYPACSLGDESETLWRLYCKDDKWCTKDASCTKEEAIAGAGVALETRLGNLEASVEPHDLYVSPIIYRHYHEGEAFNDERDPFM